MINSIDIKNFRCFEHLSIDGIKRFNVIVGENGAGKTALLEAIFLALSGNAEVSVRLKHQRGFDATYAGAPRAIEEAIWRDYFFNLEWSRLIEVELNGTGSEARCLRISRGVSELLIPFEGYEQKEGAGPVPLVFSWRDASGHWHPSTPRVTSQGIQLGASDEELPNFFFFPANQTVPASENAARLSEIRKNRREREFVRTFTREFPWFDDLTIEVTGGLPMIHVKFKDEKAILPLNVVSGGINRILGVMLAISSRSSSVVIVDEMENGLYYKHKPSLWRAIMNLGRKNNAQMFVSTHDEEWLNALIEAADEKVDDISLWRMERLSGGKRVLRQFTGKSLKSTIAIGGEMR